jgi:hypothetical protein
MRHGRLDAQPGILAVTFRRGIRAFRIMVDCRSKRPVVGQIIKLPVALVSQKLHQPVDLAERSHFGRSVIGNSLVCDMPDCKRLVLQIEARADLSQKAPGPLKAAEHRQKNGPEKSGPSQGGTQEDRGVKAQVSRALSPQSPKRGRSPLRAEIRALAISRRSIEAIRRPNKLLEGTKPMEAVLDIGIPFSKGDARPVVIWELFNVYQIPGTMHLFAWQHGIFCSAALGDLPSKRQKGRRIDRRPFSNRCGAAYSAACLRGGSSAPEPWISATW